MFFKQKSVIALIAALVLGAVVFAVVGYGGQGAKAVVAEVNGDEITRGELDDYINVLRLFMPNLEPMLGDEARRPMLEGQILEAMVENLLLKQAAAQLNVTVSEAELQGFYEMSRAQMIGQAFASEEELTAKMQELQINEEALIAFLGNGIYTEKLEAHFISAATDEEIQQFLTENPAYGENPAMLELSHILLATEEEALAARERLTAGADFGDLAVELSTDPSAKNEGERGYRGYLGAEIPEVNQMFVEEFMAGANELENDGEISPPVESEFGWHLIKLHKRLPSTELTPEESRQNAARALGMQRAGEFMQTFQTEALIERRL
ncbi:MAG: SurA N-terminal domain-containing protein [Dethiobacter sp.]|jgi:parvulin-like peptidyl-prolyl isomerase|nr:SurA N-terminal domain-containing protein [Dethiobacter sp.]MBS3899238.1 SurA N-terminal domain-containing protein [Dethiobacter sp.]MBS3982213.1 SurA N-terminal domain-containing protein [Dethiobacter sp.]MCL4463872.1 SurA N-terminal domain-containing protein [Bacillota bacterium]MCL5992639.1 SurA N-terminal domain-containing protein [Bacillota bacterium]